MHVKRIIANLAAPDPSAVDGFYREILGLELAMDHGWIRTYAGDARDPLGQLVNLLQHM
jgi:catechol 2,3-dioxygenase-like lactoylglutathione lyase family enzyme